MATHGLCIGDGSPAASLRSQSRSPKPPAMSYRLQHDEPMAKALRRLVGKQVESILEDLHVAASDTGAGRAASASPASASAPIDRQSLGEGVHEARKRAKKVRAVLRLFRSALPEYGSANAAFRDAARLLSSLREADALLETHARIAPCAPDSGPMHEVLGIAGDALQRRRARAYDDVDVSELLRRAAAAFTAAGARVEDSELDAAGWDAVQGGLRRTYERARRRLDDAYAQDTPEAFHQWRKSVKYHRYHMRLLQEAWPPVLKAHEQALDALGDLLGHEHDLAVYRAAIAAELQAGATPEQMAALHRMLDERSRTLRACAHSLGKRSFAEKPKAFVRRMRRYFSAWQAEADVAEHEQQCGGAQGGEDQRSREQGDGKQGGEELGGEEQGGEELERDQHGRERQAAQHTARGEGALREAAP